MKTLRQNLNYERPIAIADGVYWVGYFDPNAGFHCNPYLIIDGDEAVLLDGGSRPDFPTVMMKILQTGVQPSQIKALIYHHSDPDLCGSVYHFEEQIGRPDLKIISSGEEGSFIRYYGIKAPLLTIEELGFTYTFSSGRTLRFVLTPFAHSTGAFVTFDEKTGIVFSSDLLGGYSYDWDLFFALQEDCHSCQALGTCPKCSLQGILDFHQRLMTSEKALRYAIQKISELPFKMIAPQHGSVLDADDSRVVLSHLATLKGVGIDGVLQ